MAIKTYLGQTPINQVYLGQTLINKEYVGSTSTPPPPPWESLVPTNLASSSFIDTMIAPYITASIDGTRIYELYSGGYGDLSGNLAVSGNAIQGFISGSDEISITTPGFYNDVQDHGPGSGLTESILYPQTWEFWFKPTPWQSGSEVPIMNILTIANNDVVIGVNYELSTYSNNNSFNVLNPFSAYSQSGVAFNSQSAWDGDWTYFAIDFRSVAAGGGDYDLHWDFYWKTKSGVTGSYGIIHGGGEIGPNITNGSGSFQLYGYDDFDWGVIRHYYDVRLTADEREANFQAEKDYFI